MRRKLTFLVTLWWVILCGTLGACLLLFANKVSVVSEEENRTLAGMPALSLSLLREGGLDEAFESFLCDKFFLRAAVVDGATAAKQIFSALTVDDLLSEESEEAFVPALIDSGEAAQDESEERASQEQTISADGAQEAEEQLQSTLPGEALGDSASVWLEQKDGSRTALLTYSREEIQKAADVLNSYAALLPEGGKLNVMLTPRAQTVNKLALHTGEESGWSSEVEPMLHSLVSDRIVVYSTYDILQEPILSGEYVYFRTDHHWTARGAYLAADAMLKDAGYQTVPLGDYSEKSISGYLGSIYLHGRNAKLKDLADTIEVFYPVLPAQSYRVSNAYKKGELPVIDESQTNYLVFLGGTHGPYRLIEGGYHTGRNMLLVCDSFGNTIAPFFLPYYDDVYLVDFRDAYYSRADAQAGVAEYIERCDITDIYVILSESNGIGTNYLNRLMPANIN